MSALDQASVGTAWHPQISGGIRDSHRPQNGVSAVIAQTSTCRVDIMRRLVVRAGGDEVVISHISRSRTGHGLTEPQAKKTGYAVCVHLDELASYDVWRDEKHSADLALPAGTVHISDMRHSWLADIQGTFQVLNFYIPQSALDEFAEGQDLRRAEALHCPMDERRTDPVVMNVAMALLPALMRPEQANRVFLDHTWRALTAHLVRAYGSDDARPQAARGGLAPWQERRAKELLLANLDGNVTLPELAQACRLSCSHFSQAFRQTVGCPPHQWLLSQKIERSKELILNSDQPLSEIALATGFADQSHFTRVFSRLVKKSPAAWGRAQER
ncbi:helix-turn-helix transcriptional regulator [Bradyrhizobium sp. INPA01-394B]|uniref:Helix-turn-helix transcriptional regulator n=1 Tax=Bradyrhizobium campsiandrae TaxID=1729892 RepID=A0ABR7U2V7_9BRAD|nr:AraC family transcriptional regulator [Bradyrhizobium campsiandrae]MBC9877712.1 helix-turn-helix transcriptional regulator [Bradyrhizobium campsiandrae]MBC9977732.1 helix-turn-helix transcriptional regulator [Bradyrhizobium campsiandrae]